MIDKDDKELIDLFKRLRIGITIIIIFSCLLIAILINKFNSNDSDVIKRIKNQESLYILVYDNTCKTCKRIEEILTENSITYKKIDTDKSTDYKKVLKILNITEYDISKPTLLYVSNGKFSSSIVDIKDEEVLNKFIEYNKSNE